VAGVHRWNPVAALKAMRHPKAPDGPRYFAPTFIHYLKNELALGTCAAEIYLACFQRDEWIDVLQALLTRKAR
jgi:hypothetical protein